jgi:hypothetical protein
MSFPEAVEGDGFIIDRAKAIEIVAAAAHQANLAYCVGIGDGSQPPWSLAPAWQRDSVISGVEGALAGNSPEQSHESWLARKRAEGWTYGAVRHPDAKTHPCLLPYSDLAPEQKLKDELFVMLVHELAPVLGLEVAARP